MNRPLAGFVLLGMLLSTAPPSGASPPMPGAPVGPATHANITPGLGALLQCISQYLQNLARCKAIWCELSDEGQYINCIDDQLANCESKANEVFAACLEGVGV